MRRLRSRIFANFLLLAGIVGLQGRKSSDTRLPEDFRLQRRGDLAAAVSRLRVPMSEKRPTPPKVGVRPATSPAFKRDITTEKSVWMGVNVAMLGNLADGTPDRLFATLYADRRATPEQGDALQRILSYMNADANQPPVPFRRIKTVPITFHESSDLANMRIAQEKALLKRGCHGKSAAHHSGHEFVE